MNKYNTSLLVTKLSDKATHFATPEDYAVYIMHKQSLKAALREQPVGMYRIHVETRLFFPAKPKLTIEPISIAAFDG